MFREVTDMSRLRELEDRKASLEDWFWEFPDSPNDSVMRNEYMIILGEIEELKSKAEINE